MAKVRHEARVLRAAEGGGVDVLVPPRPRGLASHRGPRLRARHRDRPRAVRLLPWRVRRRGDADRRDRDGRLQPASLPVRAALARPVRSAAERGARPRRLCTSSERRRPRLPEIGREIGARPARDRARRARRPLPRVDVRPLRGEPRRRRPSRRRGAARSGGVPAAPLDYDAGVRVFVQPGVARRGADGLRLQEGALVVHRRLAQPALARGVALAFRLFSADANTRGGRGARRGRRAHACPRRVWILAGAAARRARAVDGAGRARLLACRRGAGGRAGGRGPLAPPGGKPWRQEATPAPAAGQPAGGRRRARRRCGGQAKHAAEAGRARNLRGETRVTIGACGSCTGLGACLYHENPVSMWMLCIHALFRVSLS